MTPATLNNTALDTRPELPAHIYRQNSKGLIEAVCVFTGRILAVQASPQNLLESKWDRLTRIDTPQGPVWIEKGLNFDVIGSQDVIPYSKLLGDLLCQEITQGKTFLKACEALNLEYATVKRWERESDPFKIQLEQARRDRAEYLHEEVIDKAREKAEIKDEIAALKWAAEKGDPERFGQKTKLTGDANNPVQFVISTGISRNPPETKDVTPDEAD